MKRSNHSFRIFVLGFLLVQASSYSSSLAQDGAWINHVSPSYISDITIKDGDLYCATSGGLLIFSPADSSFSQFNNTIGLPTNFLTCLAFDSRGALWVGTDRLGIARLEEVPGGYDVRILNATFLNLVDDRVTSITAWGDSVAYGTAAGAGLIIEGFPSSGFFEADGLPSDVIDDVFADGDVVWFATDAGVAHLDRLNVITAHSNGLPSLDTHVLARDDTTLWVGTSDGIARFRTTDSTWVPAGLAGESVFSIEFDGSKLWAATRFRLYENDGTAWVGHNFVPTYQKYSLNQGLSEVRGLEAMADGSIYMGTGQPDAGRGPFLLVYDGSTVRDLPTSAPPGQDLLRTSFDIDGSLWVSSFSFGVGKLMPSGTWFNYNSSVGDTNLTTRFTNIALLADSQGSKWFGSLWTLVGQFIKPDELQDGLDADYDNDVWIHHDLGSGGGDGLGSLRNQKAFEDPAGNRWLLSDVDPAGAAPPEWRGISIFAADRSGWLHVNPTSTNMGMPTGNITDVAFGPGGVVWVADREDGVFEWRTGGYDKTNLFDLSDDVWAPVGSVSTDFNGGAVTSVALRTDSVVWVGSEEGVYKLKNNVFTRFRANRGSGELLSNTTKDLALDHRENLWVASDLGLDRIARNDDIVTSFTTLEAWQSLALFFASDVVSPLADAFCHAVAVHPSADLLYVATRHGLSILDLSSLEPGPTDLSSIYVYPNPIRTRRGHLSLKIANHNGLVDVEIYTMEGELVHRVENVGVTDEVVWDLTTNSGFLAASGVYLIRIRTDVGTVVRSVSLIR